MCENTSRTDVSDADVGGLVVKVVGGYMYLLLLELPRFFVDATDNDSCQ